MTKRLGEEDRRAIDLLLDRAAASTAGNGHSRGNGHSNGDGNGGHRAGYTMTHGVVAQNRVDAAERVLSLLDNLPADEPSEDLLFRTLKRIDSTGRPVEMRPVPGTFAPGTQPHA